MMPYIISFSIIALYILCRLLFRKNDGVQIENIRAKIMLSSNDIEEITTFLMNKEPYITQQLINQLIDRIAELKSDAIIESNWKEKQSK